MNAEQLYRVFQIRTGRSTPVDIDPDDPKGIKAVQAILRSPEYKAWKARHEAQG